MPQGPQGIQVQEKAKIVITRDGLSKRLGFL
jgi:hypothetical protein